MTEGEIELIDYLRDIDATGSIDLGVAANRQIPGDAVLQICHRDRARADAAAAALNALPKNARHK